MTSRPSTPSLDRVLALSGAPVGVPEADHDLETSTLLLSAWAGLETAMVRLASDPDDDGDDDSDAKGDTDHDSHKTFKAMKKRGMSDKDAAKICAKADAKSDDVKATRLARGSLAALEVALSVTQADRDKAHDAGNSLPDKSYPINNVAQLKAAAHLANTGHGDVKAAKALIRKRAGELNVPLNTLEGFEDEDSEDGGKVAATMVALAAKTPDGGGLHILHPGEIMHHGPHTGTHTHPHMARVAVNRPHLHNHDNIHDHPLHPGMW